MRRLLKSPAYLAFSLLTLSLGIGATTAAYAALRTVLFASPSGLKNPGLVNLYHQDPREGGSLSSWSFGVSEYQAIRDGATIFDALIAHAPFRHAVLLPGGAQLLWGELSSGNYFDALGLRPAWGRLLQEYDDTPTAPPVAVISYALWQREFGSSGAAVGSTVSINGSSYEVVGVAPHSFRGTFNPEVLATAVWIPLSHAERLSAPGQRFVLTTTGTGERWLMLKALRSPSATGGEAATQLATIARRLDQQEPLIDTAPSRRGRVLRREWTAIPTRDIRLHGQGRFFSPILASAMSALVLVVLIACINVANLTATRTRRRSREIIVRSALGATPARLLRAELVESIILAALGCLLGLLVAFVVMRLMAREIVVGAGASLSINPVFDSAVLLAAALSTVVAFVCFGLVPVVTILRATSRQSIARDTDNTGSLRWPGRKRLVALQVSVSVALLAAAAVCALRIQDELRRTSAINIDRLAMLQLGVTSTTVEPDQITSIVEPVRQLLAAQPGIEEFAVASGLPPLVDARYAEIIDSGNKATSPRFHVRFVAATPDLFDTIGLRITHGRPFRAPDDTSREAVAMVSRRLAVRLAGPNDAVGRQITYRPQRLLGENASAIESARIVGVVNEIGDAFENDRDNATLYVPMAQKPQRSLILIARSQDPRAASATLLRAFRAIRPDLSVSMAGPAEVFAGTKIILPRLGGWLMSFLGVAAFVLALIGLYSVLTLVVDTRRREVGIRMALGASERQVVDMILKDGLSPVVVGLGVGLLVAAVGWSTASKMLSFSDPTNLRMLVLSTLALLILIVAYLACRIPARRAARVDPSITLRHL